MSVLDPTGETRIHSSCLVAEITEVEPLARAAQEIQTGSWWNPGMTGKGEATFGL